MILEERKAYFNSAAADREQWKSRNWYYHETLGRLLSFLIPPGKSVLEIGAGTGDTLALVKPKRGLGVDISAQMVGMACVKYPQYEWHVDNAENLTVTEHFDYIIMSDLLGYLDDIERAFQNLQRVSHDHTKIVITYYNYLWEPILRFAEYLYLKRRQPLQNWMSPRDIENMLYLAGFEVIKEGRRMIYPVYVPFISAFLNRFIGNLPFINRLGIIQYMVARSIPRQTSSAYAVSIVIPCRNEKGNIEHAVKRIPSFGSSQEIIFVEKGSVDGTLDEIKRVTDAYADTKKICWFEGIIDSKRDKVRFGFEKAMGDILMILDADLTVMPEDLPKFYHALASGRGEFINGSRLVYPMEEGAMRFFNVVGNKFFSAMFTWLLGQRIKDTLCGTKVLFKKDYDDIVKGREYFGDFDPFGDFDLLFGATKLNLKIVEMPIRYQARTYGKTNIKRWRHGVILLRMVWFAMGRIKFI